MNTLEAAFPWIFEFLLRASVVLIAADLALRVFSKRIAGRERHDIALLALSATVAIALVGPMIRGWMRFDVASSVNRAAPATVPKKTPSKEARPGSTSSPRMEPLPAEVETPATQLRAQDPIPKATTPPSAPASMPTGALFLAIYLLGIGTFAFRRLWSHLRILHITRSAKEAVGPLADACRELALSRAIKTPRLLMVKGPSSPAAYGLVRPTILMPTEFSPEITESTKRLLLLHEIVHIARRDLLAQAIASMARGLAWPILPVHWLASRLSLEREILVDEEVVRTVGTRFEYAAGLFHVASALGGRGQLIGTSMASRRPSQMRQRIELLIAASASSPARSSGRTTARLRVLALLFLALALGIGTASPGQSPEEKAGSDVVPVSNKANASLVAALNWIRSQQKADGSFAGMKVSNASASTAMALLSLVRIGTTFGAEYEPTMRRAVDFLLLQQQKNGLLCPDSIHFRAHYTHAIATLALAEVQQRHPNARIKIALTEATKYILKARNPYAGWRYEMRPGDNDSCITTWMLLALHEAAKAEIAVPSSDVVEAMTILNSATDPETGRTGYIKRGERPVRPEGMTEKFPAHLTENITAMVAYLRMIHGATVEKNEDLRRSLALLDATPPEWNLTSGAIDYHYWLFGTLAKAKEGQDGWKEWKSTMSRVALLSQEKEGEAKGSWPPIDAWSEEGGRMYATVFMALALDACRAP